MLHMEEAGTGENTPWLSSANSWISNSREISSPNTENHPYTSQKWGQITLLYLSTGLCEAYENGHTILHLFLTSFCDIKCEYSCTLPWHLYLNFFSGNSSSLLGSFYDSKKVKEIQIFPFGFLWWFINDSEKKKIDCLDWGIPEPNFQSLGSKWALHWRKEFRLLCLVWTSKNGWLNWFLKLTRSFAFAGVDGFCRSW